MRKLNQAAHSRHQISGDAWANSLAFRIFLITVLTFGIFFRINDLGKKIYSHDEAYTSLFAAGYLGGEVFDSIWDGEDKTAQDIQKFITPNSEKDIADVLYRMAIYSPHEAPLFFLLEHLWMHVVGSTPAAVRGLATIFGVLCIPAMYWFAKELFQARNTALLCTGLFAISPFHILFSQDAKPYSLLTLMTLLASAALFRAVQKGDWKAWLLYSLTLIVGAHTQLLFFLIILVHGLYIVCLYFQKAYRKFASACLLASFVYAPWLFFVLKNWHQAARQLQHLNMRVAWYRYIQRWILIFSSPLIDFEFSSGNLIPYLLRALILIFVAAALLFLVRHSTRQQKIFVLLSYIIIGGALIVPDLLMGGIRSINGRYYVAVNIITIMVVGYFAASNLDRAEFGRLIKWKLLVGLLAAVGLFSNFNSQLAESWWNKELGRVSANFVHEINKDETLLIVSGSSPTNLGDVLLLSLEVDRDVRFRLNENPSETRFSGNYQNIFWFPSSYREVRVAEENERIKIREVLPGLLWRIDRAEK